MIGIIWTRGLKTSLIKKIHACGLDLLGSADSFGELECSAYLASYFVQFLLEIEVVFEYLVL
jgi:hypothetical protein